MNLTSQAPLAQDLGAAVRFLEEHDCGMAIMATLGIVAAMDACYPGGYDEFVSDRNA